jgi:hypothetical protein
MITFPTSQIQIADPSRQSSTGHGSAHSNARFRSQLAYQSSSLNTDSCLCDGLLMRRNVADQCAQWCRLPSLTPSAVLKSP